MDAQPYTSSLGIYRATGKGFVYFEAVSRAALGLNVPSSLR